MKNKKALILLLITGGVIGLAAVILTAMGNPANMGICVACFIRDISGALGLDTAATVQYIRPEIIGFILGSFILSLVTREFRPTGGSSPALRLVISFFMMIGALVFLGCPLRMVLRLAGGDLNALIGLVGFIAGILLGGVFLKKGFSLGRAQPQPVANGLVAPVLAVVLLVFLLVRPAFIFFSAEGPGSMQAPIAIALIAGLVVGGLAQRSRMCMAGGIRDVFLIKNPTLLMGYIAVFVVALIGNIILGKVNIGFENQPIAHTNFLFNFLGMALVGLAAVMLGGCPLRQVIMAGEGNGDATIALVGMMLGAATAHNFGIAASPAGVPANGQIAVVIGLVLLVVIALMNIRKKGVA
ncbi:MAG: YedE family putative selenium transporter [Oscillospiraceae bacterium]